MMAAIDKIYGNIEQYDLFYDWVKQSKPEFLRGFYPRDPDYYTSDIRPISNFREDADRWLIKNCNIDFVVERLKEQYDSYDIIRRGEDTE
jgi:hypothetical protein